MDDHLLRRVVFGHAAKIWADFPELAAGVGSWPRGSPAMPT